MTYDNANRKNIREAEKSARLAETNRIAYTRKIMSDAFGRAWLHSLLLSCSVFHTPFVASAPDITAFNCGKQNIGLQLFGDIASNCPNEYTLMMQEASTKELANDYRNESASDSAGSTSPGLTGNPPEPARYTIDTEGFVNDGSEHSNERAEAGAEA